MVKFAELISGLEIKGAKASKSAVGNKLAREVDKANRPVKAEKLTKAERKAIQARFVENGKIAREREQAYRAQLAEKRKQERAEKERKATAEKQ